MSEERFLERRATQLNILSCYDGEETQLIDIN